MKHIARFTGLAILMTGLAISLIASNKTIKEVQKFKKEGIIGWNGNIILADVNGDGYDDLVARYSKNNKLVGGIWLWKGNKFADSVDCTIDLTFITEANVTAGDLNGDGKADLAFLSQYSSYHPPKIVWGRTTWPTTITSADLLCGPVPNDSAFEAQGQYSSMTIADFNDDGYGDLMYQIQGNDTSGAYKGLYGGRLIMYKGGASMDSIPDWVYKGGQTYQITGTNNTISTRYFSPWHMDKGDFNGDGKVDFLTSGWNSYSSINIYNNQGVMQSMYNCGAGMIFLGGAGFDSIPDVIMMASDKWLRYTTPAIYLWLGYGIYNAGDVNGDGIDDVSLPGWYIDLNLVFHGKNSFTQATSNANVLVVRDEAFAYTKNRFNFAAYADQHGMNVLSIGDVNGDGLDDLAVTRNFFGGMLTEERGVDFFFSKPNQSGIITPDYSTNDYVQVMPLTIDYDGDGINEFFAYDAGFQLTILKMVPITLHAVSDVPADQGGVVKLSWNSTVDNDVSEYPYYSIWRSVAEKNTVTAATVRVSEINEKFNGSATIELANGSSDNLWEWVKNVPAALMGEYSAAVPTLNDSSKATDGLHYFMVIAHTANPNKFFLSNIDSGYSKDNLAPVAPSGVSAQIVDGKTQLTWNANEESDFAQYAVYKSFSPLLLTNAAVYAYTTETTYLDPVALGTSAMYYTLRAVDVHGNFSDKSQVFKLTLTGVTVEGVLPLEYSLSQNYPNPFNPTTTIQYSTKEAGMVTLKVVNILGEVVAELENSYKDAGRYEVKFDASRLASGVYYYQIQAGAFTQMSKMILLK
jgi:hypothetical protein